MRARSRSSFDFWPYDYPSVQCSHFVPPIELFRTNHIKGDILKSWSWQFDTRLLNGRSCFCKLKLQHRSAAVCIIIWNNFSSDSQEAWNFSQQIDRNIFSLYSFFFFICWMPALIRFDRIQRLRGNYSNLVTRVIRWLALYDDITN